MLDSFTDSIQQYPPKDHYCQRNHYHYHRGRVILEKQPRRLPRPQHGAFSTAVVFLGAKEKAQSSFAWLPPFARPAASDSLGGRWPAARSSSFFFLFCYLLTHSRLAVMKIFRVVFRSCSISMFEKDFFDIILTSLLEETKCVRQVLNVQLFPN